jgi:hypothetical protein
MSTVSHVPRPDVAGGAAVAGRSGWLFAITAWAGFIGAALMLALLVALMPGELAPTGWHELSVAFLCAWLVSMASIGLALSLALPLARKEPTGKRHGR